MDTGTKSPAPGGRKDGTSGSGPRPPVLGLPVDDVFAALDTPRRGLQGEQARDRLEKYGANELPRATTRR
ncbi:MULTISPECIES: cation-transporting P-type ATPase [unclassified Streptomyces]|uniref:Cation-transporting P-type ATPase n=1 Tax=Streptomyces sp. R17 TaxID=3238626 RepID=A0AB39NZY6_9ACTN|nr:cation-transporting P-type ATPase [Streptomyces sp. MMS20-AI2-20]